jgi:hypothetical protein
VYLILTIFYAKGNLISSTAREICCSGMGRIEAEKLLRAATIIYISTFLD